MNRFLIPGLLLALALPVAAQEAPPIPFELPVLEGWRTSHEAYFARNGGFSPDMWLVCERFTLVEAF